MSVLSSYLCPPLCVCLCVCVHSCVCRGSAAMLLNECTKLMSLSAIVCLYVCVHVPSCVYRGSAAMLRCICVPLCVCVCVCLCVCVCVCIHVYTGAVPRCCSTRMPSPTEWPSLTGSHAPSSWKPSRRYASTHAHTHTHRHAHRRLRISPLDHACTHTQKQTRACIGRHTWPHIDVSVAMQVLGTLPSTCILTL